MRKNFTILPLLILLILTGLFSPGIFLNTFLNAQNHNSQPVAVDGLSGTVSIFRDEWGVPTIFAETDRDLFVGYGYAVAKDRLWQMDGSRRLARGQIAEVAGQSQLHWDVYHRNLGIGRAADESVELLDPVTYEYLQAFSDGVNAYIETHRDNLPFEFLLMNYEPEPWTVADCLAVTRLVAVWLAADSWDEEMYGSLIDDLGVEEASKLFPAVPRTEPNYIFGSAESDENETGTADEIDAETDDECADRTECITFGAEIPGGDAEKRLRIEKINEWFEPLAEISRRGHLDASNIWAVDGSMTESGEPILAMDPHLNYFAPSILYEVILEGDEINCWGVSFPGMPFLPFGANENLVWGASNLPADCQDMFIERLNPDNPYQYEVDGRWLDFEITPEEIIYKDSGGQSQTYLLNLYRSIHGPVISRATGSYIALKWTGIDPKDEVTSFRLAMSASSIEEFYEAFREYHSPTQNLCVAENGRHGRIAQIFIGDIPIRSGYDGRSPVAGNDSSLDWVGYIPYDDLPHRIDPDEGYVAHANNIPLGGISDNGSRPYGSSFSSNHRVERIIELLHSEPGSLTFEDMQEFQMDDLDITARFFVPALLEACGQTGTDIDVTEYIELISEWDYHLSKESIAATIYQVWLQKLAQNCIGAGLPMGEFSYFSYEDRWLPLLVDYLNGESNLDWLMEDSEEEVWIRLYNSFEYTIADLSCNYDPDTSNWQWGNLNQAVFPHPSGVETLIGAGSYPWGGGRYTVRVGHYSTFSGPPYENDFGAVFRAVVGSENGGWQIGAVLPPGQAGATFAPHGTDQMEMWLNGELRASRFGGSREDLEVDDILAPAWNVSGVEGS